MILIEFTKDTGKRSAGDRLLVDERSAKSFVDRKKVAKRVGDEKPAEPVAPAPAAGDE